jgi:hypothetical protein
MKFLLHPKWIVFVTIIPSILLILVFWGDFKVIHPLLNSETKNRWLTFGFSFGFMTAFQIAFIIYALLKKQKITLFWALGTLLFYLIYLYAFSYNFDLLIPRSIPNWMLTGNLLLYTGTFLMPTMAFALFILVTLSVPENQNLNPWSNVLYAILFPMVAFVFFFIIAPFWKTVNQGFGIHSLLIIVIATIILFLFFLVRFIYTVMSKNAKNYKENVLIWKVLFAIILPLIGLSLTRKNNSGLDFSDVFGDFSSLWFPFLAILNGVLICLPKKDNPRSHLFIFSLRMLTFAYTFYFFMVFLPFLPLSVIALFAIGIGILMLTPLILFIIHINVLHKDFQYLSQFYSKLKLRIIGFLAFLIIPSFITLDYWNDRNNLNQALNYVYSPDFSSNKKINEKALLRTLEAIKSNKSNSDFFTSSNQKPYLSSYYNWLVLDNLSLSETKINTLERVFSEEKHFRSFPESKLDSTVQISKLSSRSTFNKKGNYWTTWVDFQLTNTSADFRMQEYTTLLNLPDGCWISDYYLYVGKRKEMGILAEKKSAFWIYSTIRNQNRDPGILFYKSGNKVEFRVFPFVEKEIRKTGIQFIHKEPIELEIDGKIVKLGNENEKIDAHFEDETAIYVSSAEKRKLRKIKRKPYIHFMVDVSDPAKKEKYTKAIENFTKTNKQLCKNAVISCVASYSICFSIDENWKTQIKEADSKGGFFLERAIQKAFIAQKQTATYPIFIVVTDNITTSIITKDFADWKHLYPENNLFYHLKSHNSLNAHFLDNNPFEIALNDTSIQVGNEVLVYPIGAKNKVYITDNQKGSLILKNATAAKSKKYAIQKDWLSGLQLQANYRNHIEHPELVDSDWIQQVKLSFQSRILTPYTSYLVVENQAQKNSLLRKQKQVLNGKQSFDLEDESNEMSEPSWVLAFFLLLIFIYFSKRKSRVI